MAQEVSAWDWCFSCPFFSPDGSWACNGPRKWKLFRSMPFSIWTTICARAVLIMAALPSLLSASIAGQWQSSSWLCVRIAFTTVGTWTHLGWRGVEKSVKMVKKKNTIVICWQYRLSFWLDLKAWMILINVIHTKSLEYFGTGLTWTTWYNRITWLLHWMFWKPGKFWSYSLIS